VSMMFANFLRRDMPELIKQSARTTIAVSEGGYYFYTAMPAFFPLASNNVAVQLETSLTGPPILRDGFAWQLTENERNGSIQKVGKRWSFPVVNAYSHAPAFLERPLDLSTFPPDMTYPSQKFSSSVKRLGFYKKLPNSNRVQNSADRSHGGSVKRWFPS